MNAEHFHVGVLLLQEAPGAGDGPAGAEPGDEVCDPAIGLAPDLGAGGEEVRFRIRRVLVLVELMPAWLARHLVGLLHGALGRARHRAQIVGQLDQMRAEGPKRRTLLRRDRHRQGRGEVEPARVGEHGQRHSRVPRSGLDQMLEFHPALDRVPDQVRGDPVFDRAEGVVPLELGVDLRVLERADAMDPHQRRGVLDAGEQFEDRVVDPLGVVGHGGMVPGVSTEYPDGRRRGQGHSRRRESAASHGRCRTQET
jgi:hypothetical protein